MYLLFIAVPLLSVIILNLPFRAAMQKAAFGWFLALITAQICAVAGYLLRFPGWDLNAAIISLPFSLHIDKLSCAALLSVGLVAGAALFVGKQSIKDKEKFFNFVSLLLIALSGMNGVIMVTDIFSLYVFIEITAVASYILISFYKDRYALESAFKYIILSSVATVMMLLSIALLLLIAGSTDFSILHAALKNSAHNSLIIAALGVFMCALFIKGGVMPFHGWLPDVYSSAPAAVSILLAGIVTKVLGVFILIRMAVSVIAFNNPMQHVVLFIGALSIVAGALAALGQSDFKRMLAYSSISQVGYIVIGLGSGSALGIAGSVFHLFNHAVFKSALFINSAALESQTGTRDIRKLGGLVSKMPVTGITSIISSLSAAGIPPLSGFWSKLIIIVALWRAGYYGYAVVAVTASVLTLAYFLFLQRSVFLGNIREEFADVKEAGFGLLFPVCVLAAITVGLGLVFPLCLKLLKVQ